MAADQGIEPFVLLVGPKGHRGVEIVLLRVHPPRQTKRLILLRFYINYYRSELAVLLEVVVDVGVVDVVDGVLGAPRLLVEFGRVRREDGVVVDVAVARVGGGTASAGDCLDPTSALGTPA